MKYDVRGVAINCSVDFHSTTREFSINDVLFKSQISPIQEEAHPPVCSLYISLFLFPGAHRREIMLFSITASPARVNCF